MLRRILDKVKLIKYGKYSYSLLVPKRIIKGLNLKKGSIIDKVILEFKRRKD